MVDNGWLTEVEFEYGHFWQGFVRWDFEINTPISKKKKVLVFSHVFYTLLVLFIFQSHSS